MIVDHDEIEALLAQAQDLTGEAEADALKPASARAPAAPPRRIVDAPPEVARILKIQVPVIVQLAARRMSISAVRKLSLGMIIEFHKSVDAPLELLINNHPVGKGDAVKVGEHFGLRVLEIRDAATRIKSLGK
ncbi:MAG: FliM/FliN family flagellar motor switch protein [Phycisphaerae bacterium]